MLPGYALLLQLEMGIGSCVRGHVVEGEVGRPVSGSSHGLRESLGRTWSFATVWGLLQASCNAANKVSSFSVVLALWRIANEMRRRRNWVLDELGVSSYKLPRAVGQLAL